MRAVVRAGRAQRTELRFRNPDSFSSIDNPPEEFQAGPDTYVNFPAANERAWRRRVRAEIPLLPLLAIRGVHTARTVAEIEQLAWQQLRPDRMYVGRDHVSVGLDDTLQGGYRDIHPQLSHDQRALVIVFEHLLAGLTATQRDAVHRVYWEGMSLRAAAADLGIKLTSLAERLTRARANLRRAIVADFQEDA